MERISIRLAASIIDDRHRAAEVARRRDVDRIQSGGLGSALRRLGDVITQIPDWGNSLGARLGIR